ncbi:MAG: hypothetical protein LBP87_00845 [Planctomycetaceae bacterium]|jgi:hypothetical protein|nr:hypothetical protein [Planctomycetaceae bacterium]
MFSFGQRKIVSLKEKQEEAKRRIEKTVRKTVKKATPPIVVSGIAIRLAKEFVNFVLSLPTDNNKYRRKPQVNKWAEQLQKFMDSSDHGHVSIQVVFEWYAVHHHELWKIESPQSFIKHFDSLLKQYEQSINPYTSQQLEQVMSWLFRLRWKCRDEELTLIVGRSLWMVQQLLDKCNGNNDFTIKPYDSFCKIINSNIGNSFDFVQFYFEQWFWEHSNMENIRVAEITKKKILHLIQTWLIEYGVDDEVIKKFISMFDCLQDISFCSINS